VKRGQEGNTGHRIGRNSKRVAHIAVVGWLALVNGACGNETSKGGDELGAQDETGGAGNAGGSPAARPEGASPATVEPSPDGAGAQSGGGESSPGAAGSTASSTVASTAGAPAESTDTPGPATEGSGGMGSSSTGGATVGGGGTGPTSDAGLDTPDAGEGSVLPEPVLTEPVLPELAARPAFVASGEEGYWQVGALVERPETDAEVLVDTDATAQTWDGFGGTLEEASWQLLLGLDEAERNRALRLLFDVNEAHFVSLRLPIGASEYALERYSLDDVADDYAMEQFSIERDREFIIPYLEATLALNPEIALWAVPWSPPAWMKFNDATDRGSILDDPMTLDAYALYLARYVEEYADAGFTIDAIAVQNDPSIEMDLPTCLWSGDLFTRFIRDHLGPTFQQRGVPAQIWFGSVGDQRDAALVDAFLADDVAWAYVSAVAVQWDALQLVPKIREQMDLPIVQAQHKPDNSPWSQTFQEDTAPNDHDSALLSWSLLQEWIDQGVNSYHAWHLVLDERGIGLDELLPWPKSALLVVDREASTLTVTPTYYLFRHFSHFVNPGAVKVGLSAQDLQGQAFQNPDGSVVTVLHNPAAVARTTTLGVFGTTYEFTIPARGFATVNVAQ
jgi:glucosylceramidase